MFSDRIKQLAHDFGIAQEAWKQDSTNDELSTRTSEAYERFVTQLEEDGISYTGRADAVRIATGIVSGTFDVRYHGCGQAVVRDGSVVKIFGGRLAGRVIDRCPKCQKLLNAYLLYADPGGDARDLLREAGLYPAADDLKLVRGPGQRVSVLQELAMTLDKLGDGDMLSVYAVAVVLWSNSTGEEDVLRPSEPTTEIVEM